MKMQFLKPSQFNYISTEDNGDLLLYNFAQGIDSLCFVSKKNAELCRSILTKGNRLAFLERDSVLNHLFKKGLLVPEEYNEMNKVEEMFYEGVLCSNPRIIIMPTEQCNFRCRYCYESYKKGEMTVEQQTVLLKFVQRKIISSKRIQISWFGGEPLESKNVVFSLMSQIVAMCQKNNVQVISDMTTNGYNLDKETFGKLYSLNIFTYQITLDGLQEQHDKQRVLKNGEGTFNRILDNLLYIKNNYTKFKFASILIRVNISRSILERLPEFIQFYKKHFGNDRRFALGLTPICDMGGEVVKGIRNQFVDISEIYSSINQLGIYNDTSIQLSNIIRALSPSESLCYASKKNTYVIGSDLSIYKCTVHFELEENKIGKLLPNGEPDINEYYHEQWYSKMNLRDCCKSCFMLPCCFGGGCPHKRVFYQSYKQNCILSSWKTQITNALRYVSKRMVIEEIVF